VATFLFPISFAGFPAIIVHGSTDLVTTAPRATTAPSPTVTPFPTVAFAHTQDCLSKIIGATTKGKSNTSGRAGGLICEPLKAVENHEPPKGGNRQNNFIWSNIMSGKRDVGSKTTYAPS
jgi:hypothetical protein